VLQQLTPIEHARCKRVSKILRGVACAKQSWPLKVVFDGEPRRQGSLSALIAELQPRVRSLVALRPWQAVVDALLPSLTSLHCQEFPSRSEVRRPAIGIWLLTRIDPCRLFRA
jgi:hypothetical protein